MRRASCGGRRGWCEDVAALEARRAYRVLFPAMVGQKSVDNLQLLCYTVCAPKGDAQAFHWKGLAVWLALFLLLAFPPVSGLARCVLLRCAPAPRGGRGVGLPPDAAL